MNMLLSCKNIKKSFGKKQVLNNTSFTLERNKIYGLLGRNGTGKTTLLSVIAGLTNADSGKILINNKEQYENREALNDICFIGDSISALSFYRIDTILKMARGFYPNWDKHLEQHLIKKFDINISQSYSTASKGKQAIVSIIIALSSRAPLTLLDEPITGLDAAARDLFYQELLQDYDKNPRTFIISTHYIDEIANVIEDLLVLQNGKIVLQENVTDLLNEAFTLTGSEEDVREVIKNRKILDEEQVGNTLICTCFGVLSDADEQLIVEKRLIVSPVPLQKLFVYLTSREEEKI